MRSSYRKDDVTILLKDITGLVEPKPAKEREKLIQSGTHYCEMLPVEYSPSEKYMEAYKTALEDYAKPVAEAIGNVAEKIYKVKGKNVVLVSLARAGIPAGILIKRYIKWKYHVNVMHYTISIIRGRGIDENAMKYILDRHKGEQIQFVDGWIGKGAILKELKQDLAIYPDVSPELAVIADPAFMTNLCGVHGDLLIPSSCLNATVSGLISRTFLRDDIIGKDEFHGALYYENLEEADLSYEFIDTIEQYFQLENICVTKNLQTNGLMEVKQICKKFQISDINFVKPGIGETTRVLLRRVPWKVLINKEDKESKMLRHLLKLAEEKNVPVEYYPLVHYKACGIIKKCADI